MRSQIEVGTKKSGSKVANKLNLSAVIVQLASC